MRQIKQRKEQIIMGIILLVYLFAVLWFTVLSRATRIRAAQYEIFWSYRKWFAGGKEIGPQILANIVMFVPLGFLLPSIFRNIRLRFRWLIPITIIAAVLFSATIEVLQLFLKRGSFEWDDLFSNTIGALIGLGCNHIIKRWKNRKLSRIVNLVLSVLILVICSAVIFNGDFIDELKLYNTSRAYCFQIDNISYDASNHQIEINGIAFRYKNETATFALSLKSTSTGKRIKFSSISRIKRPDVNSYFACEHDYTQSGFKAIIASDEINPSEEYEVLIRWTWSFEVSTGVFITGSNIHYVPEQDFITPDGGTDLQAIVENGTLRVYRPDYHCWIYQVGSDLYWIVNKGFSFEEDNTTYIQYQIWTTQIEKLPKKRLAHYSYWDNIGDYFEKYELIGNFGDYRVSKRELPTTYSIISILTGYYKNNKWIWSSYFRPIYDFEQKD